jgi:hypothetical protein
LLTGNLLSRGLGRVHGQLAFVHKGEAISLRVDATIYRGSFITIIDRGHKVREFRAGVAGFNWNAIAVAIVDVAERRLKAPEPAETTAASSSERSAADLWAMLGSGVPSQLSLEPSQDKPGRVRVRLKELDLDPVAALQLYAAVSRVLSPSN